MVTNSTNKQVDISNITATSVLRQPGQPIRLLNHDGSQPDKLKSGPSSIVSLSALSSQAARGLSKTQMDDLVYSFNKT